MAGSSERETRALMVAVLGRTRNVQDFVVVVCCVSLVGGGGKKGGGGKGTYLSVLELNQSFFIHHDLIPLVLARLEQLRQREPLPRHLVPVVGVHELVVVDAVRGVALHALDRGFAAV